jgi:hypothetical protein
MDMGVLASRTLLFHGLDRSHPEAVRKMLRDIHMLVGHDSGSARRCGWVHYCSRTWMVLVDCVIGVLLEEEGKNSSLLRIGGSEPRDGESIV